MRTVRQIVPWHDEPVNIPGIHRKAWHTEDGFQIFVADWIRKRLATTGNVKKYDFWHHSANERKGAKAGFLAKMKGQGKGYPDLVHHGLKLAVELKVFGGSVSVDQKRWLKHFRSLGYKTAVVYTFREFLEIVEAA